MATNQTILVHKFFWPLREFAFWFALGFALGFALRFALGFAVTVSARNFLDFSDSSEFELSRNLQAL